jgi:hypothetical protein
MAILNRKEEDASYERGGMAFIGSAILGIGLGWMIQPAFIVQGALVGLGFGFILMALLRGKS